MRAARELSPGLCVVQGDVLHVLDHFHARHHVERAVRARDPIAVVCESLLHARVSRKNALPARSRLHVNVNSR